MATAIASSSSSAETATSPTQLNNNNANNELNDSNHWHRVGCEMLAYADVKVNGNQPWDIQIYNNDFFKRVLHEGSLGLGESYMDGWWDCERLDMFFQKVFRAELDKKMPRKFSDKVRIASSRLFNHQSKKKSRKVGKEHYDLGNDLFSRMLDPYMQYSCAYWKDAKTLEDAQVAKLRLICEKLQLKPGMKVLDIGCGWGGLAQFAATEYGVSIDGVTISEEQQKMAQERCAGLDVNIILQDYRDIKEEKIYDRIVSVGMYEHVGPKNHRTFFEVASRLIKPDGLFLLHFIGANTTKYGGDPWIHKYIFPNGVLPSLCNTSEASEDFFVTEDVHNFGQDYDTTLLAWHERFVKAWPEIQGNYSERFKKMFTFYLLSCAGAFRCRSIQLYQFLLSPKGVEGGIRVPR